MNDSFEIAIEFPTDDQGMVGRECPECEAYFKIKPGTGIPDIETTACPYCEHQTNSSDFLTKAQLEYALSVAAKKALGPALRDLERSLKQLEKSTRGSFIQFKVTKSGLRMPVKYYSEADLETMVECDYCGLEFSIFDVFGICPDCLRPNSMSMFRKSIEIIRKRLQLHERIPPEESDLRESLLADCLSASVSTFDSLGKRLRSEYPQFLPSRPRNLFQNLEVLEEALQNAVGLDLKNHLGPVKYDHLNFMFQVRHIWIHNFGEIDESFLNKTGFDQTKLGKRIVPSIRDIDLMLEIVSQIGVDVRKKLGEGPNNSVGVG